MKITKYDYELLSKKGMCGDEKLTKSNSGLKIPMKKQSLKITKRMREFLEWIHLNEPYIIGPNTWCIIRGKAVKAKLIELTGNSIELYGREWIEYRLSKLGREALK